MRSGENAHSRLMEVMILCVKYVLYANILPLDVHLKTHVPLGTVLPSAYSASSSA